MSHNSLWRAVLSAVLCLVTAAPALAESFQTLGDEIVAGIVVVAVAVGVLVTVLILHQKRAASA